MNTTQDQQDGNIAIENAMKALERHVVADAPRKAPQHGLKSPASLFAELSTVDYTRHYKPRRFDLFGFDPKVHPEVDDMHKQAQWFLNDIENKMPRRWLTLLGGSGIGKTHLAKAIAEVINTELRPKNKPASFFPWQQCVRYMREGDWGIVNYLIKCCPVLVIDDIGAENITKAMTAALNEVIDRRLGKWTVITSNLSAEQLGNQFDQRIASRLFRGHNVVVEAANAPDYCFERYKKNHSN